jgi:hypothetical protein
MIRLVVSIILGFIAAWLYELLMLNLFNGKGLIVSGWRLHHSLYGLPFLVGGFLSKKAFFAGFGLGIIAQHSITDGFWFITKEVGI